MSDYIFSDVEIRRIKDGKRFYIRKKINKRGYMADLTIRTQRNGKGSAVTKTKVKDCTSIYEMGQAMARLQKKFGRFNLVFIEDPSEYYKEEK